MRCLSIFRYFVLFGFSFSLPFSVFLLVSSVYWRLQIPGRLGIQNQGQDTDFHVILQETRRQFMCFSFHPRQYVNDIKMSLQPCATFEMAYVWICCHECESVWVFLPLSFSKLFTWPCDDVVSKTHFTLIRHECESVWIEHRHRCFIVVLLAFHSISFCVTFLFMHCQGIQVRLACVCCAVNTNGRGNINLWTFCTISFNVARIVERFIIVRNHRRHWFTIATVWVGEILRDSLVCSQFLLIVNSVRLVSVLSN